jgi:capsular exopolysaccharide synthesis family protein
MQKVMQKVRTAADPPPAADAPAADATSSAFVSDPADSPATPAADTLVDGRTANWDAGKIDDALVAFHERYSPTSEQYRSLRARLLNMNPRHVHQAIAVTSSIPQEGKSVTAINLSMVTAEGSDHRVCLVDADFRRASIARMLGLSPSPGLAELIRGTAKLSDVLRPSPLPNLKVITAGSASDKRYGELLGTSAVRSVLADLRETFDYSFLDTPPVNTVSDVSMLAPHCDGAIIVIEMRRTPEPSVQEAVRTLQTTNVKILGCLLSRYDDQRGHYYERYYSYYTSE